MSVARQIWGSTGVLTITLTGLASDANLSTGRNGTALDLTTNTQSTTPVDLLLSGSITLSSLSTTVVGGRIEVWGAGNIGGSTQLSANVSTADAAFSANWQKAVMKSLTTILVSTTPIAPTAAQIVYFGPISVSNAFGGSLPDLFNIFVTHNLSAAFHATNASSVYYQLINYASS